MTRSSLAFLLAILLLSAAAYGLSHASRTWSGPAAALVNVRWAPEVGEPARQALERRFRLEQGEPKEGTTYLYRLADISPGNIRALVTDPAVLDTHHIDRAAFALSATALRVTLSGEAAQRRSRQAAAASTVLWAAAGGVAALALLLAVAPRRMRRAAMAVQGAVQSVGRGLYGRIPEVSAEAAALFRIVFGIALLVCFVLTPVGSESIPDAPMPDDTPWPTRMVGEIFVASPGRAGLIGPWLLISGALVIAGAFTRVSFAACTAGAIAWGVVLSLRSGHHPFSVAILAMLCLLPSRWGDAWSVDAWRARRRRTPAEPREYGYTVWVPGVVLGVALAGAAAAKLMEGGIGWILNGSVKYHVLTDAANAPVDWGVRFALVPAVAVALSLGGIAVESLVLPAAIVGPWGVRFAAAGAAALLFVGFWAFHGLFWPWWWMLLLAFAPWHRLYPGRRRPREPEPAGAARRIPRLRHVQAAFLGLAAVQQVAASACALEVPPLISAYDMYSKTYSSPEAYTEAAVDSHWIVVTLADDTTRDCQVSEPDARMLASDDRQDAADAVLARCFPNVGGIRTLAVEQARRNVDWNAGRYLGTVRVRVAGPVVLARSGDTRADVP